MDELDVVELLTPADGWEAGTRGTAVDVRDGFVTVEVVDPENGATLAMLDVEPSQVQVVWSIEIHRAGETQELDCDAAPSRR